MATIPLGDADFFLAYAEAKKRYFHWNSSRAPHKIARTSIDVVRELRGAKKLPTGVLKLRQRIVNALALSSERHWKREDIDKLMKPHFHLPDGGIAYGDLKTRYHLWVTSLVQQAWRRCAETYRVKGGWAHTSVSILKDAEIDHDPNGETHNALTQERIRVLPVKVKGGYDRWAKRGDRRLKVFRSWRRRVHAEGIAIVGKHFVLDAERLDAERLSVLPRQCIRELDRYADAVYEAAWVVKRSGYAIGIQYGIILKAGDELVAFPYAQAQSGREYRKRFERVLAVAARKAVALAYDGGGA